MFIFFITFSFVRPYHYAEHKMQTIATHVVWSVCVSVQPFSW